MAHTVFCVRYKKEMEGLDEPPFDSEFGQKIYKNVSKAAWDEWLNRQKMLLNEYRLQPWLPQAQQFLAEQLEQFFFGEGSALSVGLRSPGALALNAEVRTHRPASTAAEGLNTESRDGTIFLRGFAEPPSSGSSARCVTHHQARHVHRLKVGKRQARQAREVAYRSSARRACRSARRCFRYRPG